MNLLNKLPDFLRKDKQKALPMGELLKSEDLDALSEQAKLLSGQIRGTLNERTRLLNEELIYSVLMDVANTYYKQGLEDARKLDT